MIKRCLFIMGAAALAAGSVQAETADRSKPIEIVAQEFHGDEVKQIAFYTGEVEVHQGTLEILGDKVEVVISPEGWRTLTVTGNPVKMREKRDQKDPKIDEWVHASALKAVYAEKNDMITFSDMAKLARSENGLVKDSTAGSKIVYDLRTAQSRVEGGTSTTGKKQRVTTVLAPRGNKSEEKPAQTGTRMESSTLLSQ